MEKTYTALCTETEASKKRCHKDMRDRCIGQECMAWRWSRVVTPTINENMRGYCGLAGIPWELTAE